MSEIINIKENISNIIEWADKFIETENYNINIFNNLFHHIQIIDFLFFLILLTLFCLNLQNAADIDNIKKNINPKLDV